MTGSCIYVIEKLLRAEERRRYCGGIHEVRIDDPNRDFASIAK